jgi:MoaA/NifB/PqqE/SkfB family radical SAM enzyme
MGSGQSDDSNLPLDDRAWIARLRDLLRKVGLPVTRIAAVAECLEVDLEGRDGRVLRVERLPRDRAGGFFSATKRFAYLYRGDETDGDRKIVELAVQVLQYLEPRLPASLAPRQAPADPAVAFHERFPFAHLETVETPQGVESEVLLRLTRACNQGCPFCSAPPCEEPSPEEISACLEYVGEHLPGARLAITGGEPGLRRDFGDHLGHALSLPDLSQVQVQTNAVIFGLPGRVDALPRDPRLEFFVSLHAVDPGIYDRCTGTSGMLPGALEGIRALLGAGHPVFLSLVINRENVSHLAEMIDSLPTLFDGLPLPEVHFSIMLCPTSRPEAVDWAVRYSELLPAVREASARASRLGIACHSLMGSSHAALPACLLEPGEGRDGARRPIPLPGETGYEDMERPWVKAVSCRACPEDRRCLGVPAPYARKFGLGELVPIIQGKGHGVERVELAVSDALEPSRIPSILDDAASRQAHVDIVVPLTRTLMDRALELAVQVSMLGSRLDRAGRIILEFPDPRAVPDPVPLTSIRRLPEALASFIGWRVVVSSRAGRPLCLFPDALDQALLDETGHASRGSPGHGVFADSCADCAVRARCEGVSAGYADRFGLEELTPFVPAQGMDVDDWRTRARWILSGNPGSRILLSRLIPPARLDRIRCHLPWTRLELHEPGTHGPCCLDYMALREPPASGRTPAELWNGPLLRAFRCAMAGGGRPSTCGKSCPVIAGGLASPGELRLRGGTPEMVENQIRVVDSILAGSEVVEAAPLELCFSATSYCNYDCLMCPCGETGTIDDELPGSFYDALEPWLDLGTELTVNGGEPFTSAPFRDFLDRQVAAGRPPVVGLITNGSFLTPERLDAWPRLPFREVVVSLNAATPETYRDVNRGLSWERIRTHLDALLRARREGRYSGGLVWSMVVLRRNLDEILPFARMTAADGVDVRYLLPARDRNGQSVLTSPESLDAALSALIEAEAFLQVHGEPRTVRGVQALINVLQERSARGLFEPL